jgi:hypothetical protein
MNRGVLDVFVESLRDFQCDYWTPAPGTRPLEVT